MHDMLGLTNQFSPRFLRRYANLYDTYLDAFKQYVSDVKGNDFPNENEQY
jgi:3-methyl-2-oxobutanoate hydroxymethyltransferase